MTQQWVSVIMPVHNCEKYVSKAIESILAQTYSDFEFIIINDGSADATKNILTTYGRKDSRIKVISYENNKGIVYALNKGLDAAKGKYIARMGADDWSYPERLKYQVNFLHNNLDIFMCATGFEYVSEQGKVFYKQNTFFSSNRVKKRLKKNCNNILHPSVMFRNEGFRYTLGSDFAEDYLLWKQFLLTNKQIVILPTVLVKHTFHNNKITFKNFISQYVIAHNDSITKSIPTETQIKIAQLYFHVRFSYPLAKRISFSREDYGVLLKCKKIPISLKLLVIVYSLRVIR